MASIKKGILTKAPSLRSWSKHFRKDGKRLFWKTERKAAKQDSRETAARFGVDIPRA